MNTMMLNGVLICLMFMQTSAIIGPSNVQHIFKNEDRLNIQNRGQVCRRIDGLCISVKVDCPARLRLETAPGKPWCEGTRRCCYTGCNVDCKKWCYPSTDWPFTCSNFCDGTKQSPIDICTNAKQYSSSKITFSETYNVPIDKIKIENNGHTVHASWDSSLPSRTISGGGLPGEYTLLQFHFHWGCENNRGSEHTIDGTRYAMELHLVHFKTSYGDVTEALKHDDGLAVIGIFFDVGAENTDLKPITDSLSQVVASGDEVEIDFNVALINLIPTSPIFSRYKGSLTTPTCNEVVIWSVFSTPLSLSEDQVKAFRSLKDKDKVRLCDNYRGIQPLNGRVVTRFGV